ncbi:MAG TPA: ABC transporter ATP-binding protein, partial [Opitutales bacterium]|nr:ABC transporter ATP-binding protein [Opitutales bacterium]
MAVEISDRRKFGWRGMKPFLKGGRAFLYTGLVLGLVDAAAQASVPMFFRYVINSIQLDAERFMQGGYHTMLWIGIALMIVFLPCAYLFHVLSTIGFMRFCRNLQVQLYRHVLRMSVDFFQRFKVGEITARLNTDVEAVANGAGFVMTLVWAPTLVIYSVVMMFFINVWLTLICLAMLAGIAAMTFFALPRLKKWNRDVRDASGEVSSVITEYVGIFGLLKAYSREDFAESQVRVKSDDLLSQREKVAWWQNGFTDAMQTLTRFVAPLAILFIGAAWIYHGKLMTGDLAAFWGYWLQLSGVVQGLVFTFSGMMGSVAAMDRLSAFFEEQPLVKDPAVPKMLENVRGELEFRNVHFRYPTSESEEGPVLTGLNLTIGAGERLALVGPSGAGKSTLLSLILRFHDPDRGTVLLDGEPLTRYLQKDLHSEMGIVLQESLFFAGTIEDNLRFGKPGASDAEMWAALEAANAADFVRELPRGLRSVLGERGAKLSGGQKQRLAIARLFLKNPKIVMFDEPT